MGAILLSINNILGLCHSITAPEREKLYLCCFVFANIVSQKNKIRSKKNINKLNPLLVAITLKREKKRRWPRLRCMQMPSQQKKHEKLTESSRCKPQKGGEEEKE